MLLENVCRVFEKEARREAVLGVCGDETGEASGVDSIVEMGCGEVESLFCKEDGILE